MFCFAAFWGCWLLHSLQTLWRPQRCLLCALEAPQQLAGFRFEQLQCAVRHLAGTMTFGQQNTEAEAHEQLACAADYGVNFIDTAELYPISPARETQGRTSQYIGSWLKVRAHSCSLVHWARSPEQIFIAATVHRLTRCCQLLPDDGVVGFSSVTVHVACVVVKEQSLCTEAEAGGLGRGDESGRQVRQHAVDTCQPHTAMRRRARCFDASPELTGCFV